METLDGLPDDLRVPESIPLTKLLLNKFQREASQLPSTASKSDIDSDIETVIRDVDTYIDTLVNEERLSEANFDYIDTCIQVVERLYEAYQLKVAYMKLTKAAMDDIRQVANEAADFNLNSLKQFQKNPPLGFDLTLNSYYSSIVTEESITKTVNKEPKLQRLRNIRSILENPEDPLPDHDSLDDELAVSGGKVSLKDPLSLQFLENPVRSRKCGHTYENRPILLQLRNGVTHCPISGCHFDLLVSDLVPDSLMKLRVQVFKARQLQKRRLTKLETVM
ncbi:uncharacterized protein KQ657_004247 [Scheffersomyces spartinae]|uniref:SP-RING-type domain-containing protein n=1 Tax=Scheffersomyces spartinae TaxID=45513 RepID=A0A9P7VAQ2_9ASCO|nr:uncharacterized protein KQ657_004247 [Scheffersomyces spartinae]KAG7194576.1 hypothetical protein KQ657_004247 [Scheffersomyces spartinae]